MSGADGRALQGRIIAHHGISVVVRLEGGEVRRERVKRNSGHVVGDRVVIEDRGLRSLPAMGVLRRRDTHGRVRAIAANLDVLGIVVAVRPVSPLGFVDRAIVAARAADITPFLVINKVDLEDAEELCEEMSERYAGEIALIQTSASTGAGLDALQAYLSDDRAGAFVGTSGVGKSSLLNALCPDLDLEVGEINELSGLGRHVTSTSTLHALPSGGELIDTPGFRDFGPVAISARDLAAHFPGFEAALAQGCHFRDCSHRSEPRCAVLAAVESGAIGSEMHSGYVELLIELLAAERAARHY